MTVVKRYCMVASPYLDFSCIYICSSVVNDDVDAL
jgi:hypothetical protein